MFKCKQNVHKGGGAKVTLLKPKLKVKGTQLKKPAKTAEKRQKKFQRETAVFGSCAAVSSLFHILPL